MTVALVSGGQRGLGEAITIGLRSLGWTVHAPSFDVRSATDLDRLYEQIPQLDLLVNNAGIYPEKTDAAHFTSAALRDAFEVNALGPAQITRRFWDKLTASHGRVINVSSRRSFDPAAPGFAYALSKAALNFVTRAFAAQGGVSVNAMCPGHCRTSMGGPTATLSPTQGADTALWLATEAPATASGGFYIERKIVPW